MENITVSKTTIILFPIRANKNFFKGKAETFIIILFEYDSFRCQIKKGGSRLWKLSFATYYTNSFRFVSVPKKKTVKAPIRTEIQKNVKIVEMETFCVTR